MNPVEDWLSQPGGLAARLREMRAHANLSGKELAEAAGWQQSKVSRIENGRQVPSEDDIRTWIQVCGNFGDSQPEDTTTELVGMLRTILTERGEWRRRMRRGQAAVQAVYNELTTESAQVRQFDTATVPGLLQTRGYAEQMLIQAVRLGHLDRDDIDAAAALRMQRQQMLYDPAKQFEFLVAESALRWLPCPPDIMRGQLDRLQTVIGMPNVRFGVLPLSRQLEIVPQNGFVLYDDLAYAESFVNEGVCTPEESASYARILDLLWVQAVEGEGARRLIVAAAESLPAASA